MARHLSHTIAALFAMLAVNSSTAFAQSGVPFPPAVPGDIEPPEGVVVLFKAHAIGTQNYVCTSSAAGIAWKLLGPQATLFQTVLGEPNQQLATHFLSANVEEDGLLRPTWQHSSDSSRVWARIYKSSTDANYVEAGAIPWLSLTVVGHAYGTRGGSFMTRVAWIQRVNTSGGAAPAYGCAQVGDLGSAVLVPYTADYVFYRQQ